MLNPILSFSATRRMRSFKTLLVVIAYLLVMLGTALLIMGSLFSAGTSIYTLRSGVTCYQVLMILQFLLIILIAPAMTSGAIAGERDGSNGTGAARALFFRKMTSAEGRAVGEQEDRDARLTLPDVPQQFQRAALGGVFEIFSRHWVAVIHVSPSYSQVTLPVLG